MSIKNDGGPAFPMIRDMRSNPDWDYHEGMTLRDYFAAHAPATPWPFYAPVMPEQPDLGPPVGEDGTEYADWKEAERETADCWSYKNQSAFDQWKVERLRQHWIQWPWFYADAMLAERDR